MIHQNLPKYARLLLLSFVLKCGVCEQQAEKIHKLMPRNKQANVTIHSIVIIQCNLKVLENTTRFYWEKNNVIIGEKINDDDMTYKSSRYDRGRNYTDTYRNLVIHRVTPLDEGVYQCRQQVNKIDTFGRTLKLHVPKASKPPVIYHMNPSPAKTADLKNWVYTTVGQRLDLKCVAANGHPGASITWRIRGRFIDPGSDGTFSLKGISGSVKTHQTIVGYNRPPRYRTTTSFFRATLDISQNASLVTCYAINEGSGKQYIMTKIIVTSNSVAVRVNTVFLVINILLTICLSCASTTC